jgi:CheY-like chemotaxis protein
MFRRALAQASQRDSSVAIRQDKMLPLIPFTPDWSQSSPANPDPARAMGGEVQESISPDVSQLPLILAEPDPVSRGLICALGEKWGYMVIAVNDGLEVLAAIRAQKEPSLAVINWEMSGMNGLEICRATREMDRPVHIVIVTERAGAERLGTALDAGADDYLITPFDADELRARLRVGARLVRVQAQLGAARRDLRAAHARLQALAPTSEGSRFCV